MQPTPGNVIGPLVAILLGASAASAHNFWIEPSTFHPRAGEALRLELHVGNAFDGEPVGIPAGMLEQYVAVTAGGKRDVRIGGGIAGRDQVRFDEPGFVLLALRNKPSAVELPAADFEEYLRAEGNESVVEQRRARGEAQTPGRELFSRCAKTLLRVGPRGQGSAPGAHAADNPGAEFSIDAESASGSGAGPSPAASRSERVFDQVVGFPLELVPVENPCEATPGSELTFTLLYEGQPLPDARVTAIRRGTPVTRILARSDANGRVRLRLDDAGLWLIHAVHVVRARERTAADWESLWASFAFELPGN